MSFSYFITIVFVVGGQLLALSLNNYTKNIIFKIEESVVF